MVNLSVNKVINNRQFHEYFCGSVSAEVLCGKLVANLAGRLNFIRIISVNRTISRLIWCTNNSCINSVHDAWEFAIVTGAVHLRTTVSEYASHIVTINTSGAGRESGDIGQIRSFIRTKCWTVLVYAAFTIDT
jgi:hypothetical protein